MTNPAKWSPVNYTPQDATDLRLAALVGDPASALNAELSSTYAQIGEDEDTTPLISTAGSEVRVLTPEAAEDGYSPKVEQLWLPAKAFDAVPYAYGGDAGAPSYAIMDNRAWAWLLDDGAVAEGVSTLLTVPLHWNTVSISVHWAPMLTGGGNTLFVVSLYSAGDGESLASNGGASTGSTSAAGTTAYRLKLAAVDGPLTVYPVKVQRLSIFRNSTSGSDTLAGDVAFLGVKITRLS